MRRRWRVRMQSAAIDWWIRLLVYPAPSVAVATTRIARGQATFGPVPLQNLASAVDLQVRERIRIRHDRRSCGFDSSS